MYKIELSISTAMSLHAISFSGSDDDDIEEVNEDINEDDVADVILSTSDDDFEKLSPEDFQEALAGDEDLGDDDEEELEDEANEEEPDDNAEDDGSEQAEDKDESDGDQPSEEQPTIDEARYQEAFDLLYGDPIKASGREVQLRNPEHAKNFIEMGIDYNKKMQHMKPHLKTLRTLEKEGLLAPDKEERLNLLLEVEKGNKDALKRLIAESDIDPLDLADEDVINDSRGYTPQNHMLSDAEVEIEEALNTIEGSPSQQRTLDVMTKEFDPRSREVISENPSYIVALNQDIQNGVFDEVMKEVQYKRDMKIAPAGISDMELYIQTVGELSRPQQEQIPVQETKQTTSTQANKKRKLKMSGSKSSHKQAKKEYDPMEVLSMNDDDFMKKFDGQLQ